jgi:hypothetical protein
MSPRFQADADFNQKIVVGLRRREPMLDIKDTHAGGVIGVSDLEVLRIAAEGGRVLLSHDRRTMPAHLADFLESNTSPGMIIVSQDLDIGAAIEDIFDYLGRLPFRRMAESFGIRAAIAEFLSRPRP